MKPSSGVLLGVLGFAGLLGPPAYAQLYKWTDEQGRTHYSDTAPDKGKAKPVEIKINSYTGPAVVSSSGKPAPGPSSKGRGVPVILVGSQRMDGFEQAGLESMLRSAGH